ncbi:MAG TPA: ABC transporter permease [Candidatus Limnocylindria bacterium]|nr:ABC transporter permease [Candidatus Limnocylindria bacterium]
MIRYIGRRLAWSVLVLAFVAVLTFILIYVLPGDPARAVAGIHASAEDVARIRAALGLDEPFGVQFARYVGRLATGDLGFSFHRRAEILPLLVERFPATLQLALGGLVVGLAIGLPMGVLSAVRRGTSVDRASTATTAVLVSIPSFWLGYVILDVLAFRPLVAWDVAIFPIGGYEPWSLRHLALPALTLGAGLAAYYARLTRTAMVDQLGSDYVRTARAKGLEGRLVTWRHAFRNAMPTLVTQVGIDIGLLLGGVVVVEQVFSWPGIGRLAVEAIVQTDLPLILGTVVFATLMIVVANIVTDVAVAVLEPRLRRA